MNTNAVVRIGFLAPMLKPKHRSGINSNELSPGWQRFRDDRQGVFFIGGGDYSHSIVAGGFPDIS